MNIEVRVKKVRSLTRSFINAFKGVSYCIRNERNMRIHLTIAVYVLVFSLFYNLTALEYAVLFIIIGLVLAVEAVNTAVEAIVNLHIECYNKLARVAKDVAAGAVLICAISAVAVGCAFFLKIEILQNIIKYLYLNLFYNLIFIISIPISLLFIFCYPLKFEHIRRVKIGR
jgi:diacylglycerol kinase (ATP)